MIDFEDIFGEEDFYEDEEEQAWQEFRAEAFKLAKETDLRVIETWLTEIGFKEPVGYYNNRGDAVMEIYTNRPGVLIGKAGSSVKRFEEILTTEFHRDYNVKFVEIRGGFANLKEQASMYRDLYSLDPINQYLNKKESKLHGMQF